MGSNVPAHVDALMSSGPYQRSPNIKHNMAHRRDGRTRVISWKRLADNFLKVIIGHL